MESSQDMIRIAVLTASYAESESELKVFEVGFEKDPPPALFFAPRWPPAKFPELAPDPDPARYTFELIKIHKRTAYSQVRDAVKSGKYACFFNLCDGAKDEDRAGVEVAQALEEFAVPFTGAPSQFYEPSKPEMKRIVHNYGVRTARGCFVRSPAALRRCAGLTFPVIVKHVSGYSSIGMTKDAKCADMAALEAFATPFINQYGSAVVEEFVSGDEVTVLCCADPSEPNGVRVYPPVQMRFPEGEDFKHFDLKWATCEDIAWYPMSPDDPAYEKVVEAGRTAFVSIMGGIGYGRSDLRINRETGEVVFLELNPNCGIMYPYGEEGSADWVLRYYGANGQGHRDFIKLQIETAIARANSTRPCVDPVLDLSDDVYVLEATRDIATGEVVLLGDRDSRILFMEPETTVRKNPGDLSLGWGNSRQWSYLRHDETAPCLVPAIGGRLVAARNIEAGEQLSVNVHALRSTKLTESVPLVAPCNVDIDEPPKALALSDEAPSSSETEGVAA